MRAPLFAIGTRVRIRRGSLPIDSGLLGRTGLVVRTEPYEPDKFGIVLDGEEREREFAEREVSVEPPS
jgi:hypothetical protein